MHVVPVSDPADPRLRDYVALTDVVLRRLSEPADGLYLAESAKVIERAVNAGHQPRSVLLQQKGLDELEPLLDRVPALIADRAQRLNGPARGAAIAQWEAASRLAREAVPLQLEPGQVTHRLALHLAAVPT